MKTPTLSPRDLSPSRTAHFIRERLPDGGLFAGYEWRISPAPFLLSPETLKELESLGRVFLQFYRSVNLLYRQSLAGKQPPWIHQLFDQGKPPEILRWQQDPVVKNDCPRVIRPDLLWTDGGFRLTELDSVPGGIGLTGWLNQTYDALGWPVTGGPTGMQEGFAGIFGAASHVHTIVSAEAASYRPEMAWLCAQLGESRFSVESTDFTGFRPGDAVYRFFELFDWKNVSNAPLIFDLAAQKQILLTPPAKSIFEEKLLLALLWNRNLREFWRQELGEGFLRRLLSITPYSWVVDPAPLPPHAAIPELNLTDWNQLKTLSQRERSLILKISGFSERAWGARGVYLGSDLSLAEWSAAVDEAIRLFPSTPFVLQRYEKPALVEATWYDFSTEKEIPISGRVRLCPYYFVQGEGDAARAKLGGVLATIVPQDKKIVHGMTEAILAPCAPAGPR